MSINMSWFLLAICAGYAVLCTLVFSTNDIFAFFTAQLPEVTINKDTSSPEVNLEKRHRLHVHRHPVGASFCVFDE